MNRFDWSIRACWLVAVIAIVASSGCTSALSTAYLRDTLWDLAEHASEEEPAQEAASADAHDPMATNLADAVVDEDRRKAAIDETVARLARIGELDPAARDTLMETLQRTQQEDWPVVVEAFAASLAESHVVAKADLDDAAALGPAVDAPIDDTPADVAVVEPAAVPVAPPPPVTVEAAPVPEPEALAAEPAAFAVRNACFATRVQAWGVVERFPEPRFHPGQEVIVYFELDNLSAGQSAAGHTTCIDTTLSLVTDDGRVLRDWSFEPIAETCVSKRRDYFARYVIRLPDDVSLAECRLEMSVVDTLAGATARDSLPLEIAASSR